MAEAIWNQRHLLLAAQASIGVIFVAGMYDAASAVKTERSGIPRNVTGSVTLIPGRNDAESNTGCEGQHESEHENAEIPFFDPAATAGNENSASFVPGIRARGMAGVARAWRQNVLIRILRSLEGPGGYRWVVGVEPTCGSTRR
jgi:hypothetical protein